MRRRLAWILAALLPVAAASPARAGLRESRHNLSPTGTARRNAAGGSGSAMTASSDDLCIFCHTPHSAGARRGLWNRELAPVKYKLYESTTTEAQLRQPNGSSRLCLSCHDGAIALGAMSHHADPSLGKLTGPTVLGTDLSDDHPISFVYDQALASRRHDLANPATLTGSVKLDESGQMQCTTCHDAHLDRHPDFLVVDPAHSALCVTCHRLPHWEESAHATSPALAPASLSSKGQAQVSVGETGCSGCHLSHGAAHPQRLLDSRTEEGVCLGCHDGRTAATDLRSESRRYSAHRLDVYTDVHEPAENPSTMSQHVECVDCHNPHRAEGRAADGQISGALSGVSGVTLSGTFVREASFEYEVCLKCHGTAENRNPVVFRTDNVNNIRLLIDPQNPSIHPIADVGRAPGIVGLLPPMTSASRTSCTACHSSDAASVAGSGAPRGPHGSNYRPILAAPYRLEASAAAESFQLYALCYRCHDRSTLLNRADGFPHRLHVVDGGAGCIVCHDAHGSRQNAHLINFLGRDLTGAIAVTRSSSGALEYQSIGNGAGRCYLTCHGSDHNPKEYPSATRRLSAPLRPAVQALSPR